MSKNPSRQTPAASKQTPAVDPSAPAATPVVPETRKRGPRTDLTSHMTDEDKAILAQAKAVQEATRLRLANEEAAKGAKTAKEKVLAFLNEATTTASEIVAMGNKVDQLLGYRNGTKQKPGAKVGERRRGPKSAQ